MSDRHVDVAIIGAGTAGLNARRAAERQGATALLMDPGPLGTTCARVGCMPSKLLIAAAEAAWHAREAGIFGVDATVNIDGPRVMARVQRERDRFSGFVVESCDQLERQDKLLKGRATLVGPRTLRVGDGDGDELATVHFRSLVLATGSTPFVPPPFRGLGDRLLGNEQIFELPDLPESVLVIGVGVIGLELGQALHRLGSRVTIVGMDGMVGPLRDPKVRAVATRVFSDELDLHPDYTLESVERVPDGVHARFRDPDGAVTEGTWRYALLAAGRTPNLRRLGLEQLGIDLSDRAAMGPGGVPSFEPTTMQVGELPVFIAGDVGFERPLLHEAADEGQIAGANAATWPRIEPGHRRTPLGVVFSDPQIAVIGAGWPGPEAVAGAVDFSRQGRSRVMNMNRGWAHIYADPDTGRLTGAELLGPRVEHMAHLLAWAVQQGLTVHQALRMPFYHPVVEEGLRTALRDLRGKLGGISRG